jgi:hypothetical protein
VRDPVDQVGPLLGWCPMPQRLDQRRDRGHRRRRPRMAQEGLPGWGQYDGWSRGQDRSCGVLRLSPARDRNETLNRWPQMAAP